MEEEVLAIEGKMLRNHLPARTHTLDIAVLSILGVKPRPHSAILCLQKPPSCTERYSMMGTAEPQKRKEGDDKHNFCNAGESAPLHSTYTTRAR